MKPDYKIVVDGSDITALIKKNLIKLTINDKRGIESDKLTIVINDSEGNIELPPSGVNISVSIGMDGNLSSKGIFIIDDVSHAGPPDKITISGHGADFGSSLKEERFYSWDNITFGEIARDISSRNNITLAISDEASSIKLAHIDQENESDMNLLTRLSNENDLIFTIKENHLLIKSKSDTKTATGKTLPTIKIDRSECKSHQFKTSDKPSYSAVTAIYYNVADAVEESYRIGSEKGTNKTLKQKFSSPNEARSAATSELKRLQRGNAEMTINLSIGNENLIPDSPVSTTGFKEQINNNKWVIDEITHTIEKQSGFVSSAKLETKI